MPRKNLPKIYLRRGNSPLLMDANLRDILEALWNVAENFVVDALQIESQKGSYRKHFNLLKERGCIEIVENAGGRGRPGIAKIRLLKRTLGSTNSFNASKTKESPRRSQKNAFSVPEGFELVSKQELVRLRVKDEAPRDKRSDDNVALLFVDAANLTGQRKIIDGEGKDSGARILPIGQVNWNVVMETVGRGFRGALSVRSAVAYVSSNIPDMHFVMKSLFASHFKSVFYSKDTDALTAADIVHLCRDEMERSKRITLVLVAGDRDYRRAIECVRETAKRTETILDVWVISWKNMLSSRLRDVSDWVSFVESIPGFLDSMIVRGTKVPQKSIPAFQAMR